MISLPPLPYAYDALEPSMSAETLKFHHDKHHASYVKKTNTMAEKAGLGDSSLEDIVAAAKKSGDTGLFNNAAQAWNHAMFWESMSPEPGTPSETLSAGIKTCFGDLASLRDQFVTKGAGHFASGWVWLAATKDGKLKLVDTHDADTLATGNEGTPLLVCDLWEHAYYIDCRNDRKAYLEAWFDKLANWEFASSQFDAATGSKDGWCFLTKAMETT